MESQDLTYTVMQKIVCTILHAFQILDKLLNSHTILKKNANCIVIGAKIHFDLFRVLRRNQTIRVRSRLTVQNVVLVSQFSPI